MQVVISSKTDELELLKRNMKTSKTLEMEVEIRTYIDECQRLRTQLEEVIKSKDTFADPEELKMIEDRFHAQELVINGLRQENGDLLMTINRKDDEMRKVREFMAEMERRRKAKGNGNTAKELLKAKKQIKDKERDIMKLVDQLNIARA